MNKKISLFLLLLLLFYFLVQSCCLFENQINYKELMRDFVIKLSQYAKDFNQNFIIIPQNGGEILTLDGDINSNLATDYISAIDSVGREDLLYGYLNDDEETPEEDRLYMISFLNIAKNAGKTVLVIDYCSTISKMNDSYLKNNQLGFISFAADSRNLDNIPSYPANPYNENANNIESLNDVKNFLYIINPSNYNNKNDFLNALKDTNYDLIIIDLFFNEEILTNEDINSLKTKKNGGKRLIICYMSIGEAENYRYYWQQDWYLNPPSFLASENPNWPGNYKVKYWDPKWQAIIYGNDESYLKKILNANFDGVYLDIIDAFEYFENQ
ncbi:MAG: endo alpha-1,4 polygalactosaminidase [Exilispira sp.]|jgi:cysteinyl-tRNA synthetase|nr:endo alpha-1,4 polygalactosaminidase [Exilispira sp.]